MNLAKYHRHPAWSPSALKCAITGTMRAFDHRYGPNAPPFVATDDMNKGSLVDCLVTPPFDYKGMFAAYSTIARNTKEGKANRAEALAARLIPISTETLAQAQAMAKAIVTLAKSMQTEASPRVSDVRASSAKA